MKKNIMDFVPKLNHNVSIQKINDKQTLVIDRNKRIERLFQLLFKIPKKFYLELDDLGCFTISNIDGYRTIGDISILVKKEFGNKAEPLVPRLVKYFQILKNNKYITYRR